MKQRHVQNFLMVSAAFFAMNLPNLTSRTASAAPSDMGASPVQRVAHARVRTESTEARSASRAGSSDEAKG
jgi:hypothetical protein